MKHLITLCLVIVALYTNAQIFSVEILNIQDKLILCPLEDYKFEVKALLDDTEVNAKYSWDFGNDNEFSTNENSIEYKYIKGGKYKIVLRADYQEYSITKTIDVEVGIKPSFRNFYADKNDICLGEEITLNMPIKDTVLKDFSVQYDLRRAVWSGRGISATKEGIACGECGTCRERLEAFESNGLKDPINYVKK